ncbi:uncharacterized protein BXZ73DRAFT_88389 [Epithele typhae]|uniref:uncharacterized protein n=1 Tax=Epithele typhae TaxID=378194 RepID=UPI00200768B9|nr:uncharacterized protein BXZ73DRAFT_88389 [Epithele typhae]KAH9941224.1 hypothetical protein BXZ73DRAFT_88389 [Epithele typhae]
MMAASTTEPTKLVVHHLNDSRSQRILWLLVPYEIKKYQRLPDGIAPPALKEVNPLGTAPVITDDSRNIAESGAIVIYLIEKYGKGRGKATEAGFVNDLFYVHYSEGSLAPILVMKLVFGIIPKQAPFFIRWLLNMVFKAVDSAFIGPRLKIEAHLNKCGDWIAGGSEPTAADYMMVFIIEFWADIDASLIGPKMKAYALEKGGEYKWAKDL